MWVCGECGSDNVWRDAYVNPNDRYDVQVFDNAVCDDCGGETTLIFKEM